MNRLLPPVLATAAYLTLVSVPATAQDLSATISCLRGAVAAQDYAELDQKLRETNWDRKGGVSLTSDISNVGLKVLDAYGNSVCQETANNATSCTFKLDLTSIDVFTIRIDNSTNGSRSNYKVCAY